MCNPYYINNLSYNFSIVSVWNKGECFNCKHSLKLVLLFLSNFYFSPNDSPSKIIKNVFLFHLKSSFCSWDIQIFVFPSSPLFSPFQPLLWRLIQEKSWHHDIINCLNKKLITHFAWYLEKEKRRYIETLFIDRELKKEHFYRKIMQKMYSKS